MTDQQRQEASVIVLPYECFLLKNWLSTAEQEQLLTRCFALATEANGEWRRKAAAQEHPYINLSFDKDASVRRANDCVRACGLRGCCGACGRPTCRSEPADLYALAEAAIARALQTEAGAALPSGFTPNSVWGLVYKPGSEMPAHLDRAEGWTLSVSVGAAVDFSVGRAPQRGSMYADYAPHKPYPGQEEVPVLFESGDMLLFQGDRVFHAVDGTRDGTAPAFWTAGGQDTSGLARMGLLFRDGH